MGWFKRGFNSVPPVPPASEYTVDLTALGDGIRFDARSTFDMLDDAINSLRGLDDLKSSISSWWSC